MKVVRSALRAFTPQEIFQVLISVKRLSRPQGHSAAGRIMPKKNSNDTIGNRTNIPFKFNADPKIRQLPSNVIVQFDKKWCLDSIAFIYCPGETVIILILLLRLRNHTYWQRGLLYRRLWTAWGMIADRSHVLITHTDIPVVIFVSEVLISW